MVEKSSSENIIFINDLLEDYSVFFKKECKSYNFYEFSYKSFLTEIKKIGNLGKKDDNLIIISKEFLLNDVDKNIKNEFLSHNNIKNPHMLLITKKDLNIVDVNQLINKQNFIYQLSDLSVNRNKNKITSFYYYIVIIFQRMKDLQRLDDYIINSFQTIVNSELINQQRIKIEKLYDELEKLSKIDVLTNVLNRKALFEEMEKEKDRTQRDMWRITKNPPINDVIHDNENIKEFFSNDPKGTIYEHYGKLSSLMIDIDSFKLINDNYGHLIGDQVLREMGNLLNSNIIFRKNDIIGRYGGEEFLIILPETNAEHAKNPADRFREEIKKISFKDDRGDIFHVTVSIGISELKVNDIKCEDVINRADKALYYAKNHGKDMCVIYDEVFKD